MVYLKFSTYRAELLIKIKGSFYYETPAYHYLVKNENLVDTVNATNNESI
jgi:hypothetical protein